MTKKSQGYFEAGTRVRVLEYLEGALFVYPVGTEFRIVMEEGSYKVYIKQPDEGSRNREN